MSNLRSKSTDVLIHYPKGLIEKEQPIKIRLLLTSDQSSDRSQGGRFTPSGSVQPQIEYQYDPTRVRIVESTSTNPNRIPSPTGSQRSAHHYVSTTNLSVYETRPQRQNDLNSSTPHLSQIGYEDSTKNRNNSTTNTSFDPSQSRENRLIVLVQQLAKQLDLETKRLNDNLEARLANLTELIDKQTFIIQMQDKKIESLQKKVDQIENDQERMLSRLADNEKERENQYIPEKTRPVDPVYG